MSGIRTLNGVGSNSQNYSLIKFYNLSDLTDISGARVNLGLVGSLNVASSPYLSISAPYNGLTNRTITLNASTNSTPNTLVAYDVSGNINGNGLNITGSYIPNYTIYNTTSSSSCGSMLGAWGDIIFFHVPNLGLKKDFLIYSPAVSLVYVHDSNFQVDTGNMSIGGPIDSTKKLKVYGNTSITGSVSSDIYRPNNNNFITFQNSSGINTATLDVSGNFSTTGNITSTSTSTPSITSSGANISFNSKNITNVGTITCTSISTPFNVLIPDIIYYNKLF